MTYLLAQEAGERLRVSTSTLAFWRHKGVGPKWAKFGRRVIYRPEDLDAFVAEQFEKANQKEPA